MATTRNLRSSVLDNNQEAISRPGKLLAGPKAEDTGRSALGSIGNVVSRGRALPSSKGALVAQKKPERTLIRPKALPSLEEVVVKTSSNASKSLPEAPLIPSNPGFSSLAVEDIDREDTSDPQMVTEFVNDVYGYLRYLEKAQEIRQNYLSSHSSPVTITPKMRSVLIDWLVDVHQQFKLTQETLYLTVYIIDRYLQAEAHNTQKKTVQLIGVTAMFIASKYEEMYAPEIGDFVFITDNTYSDAQIRLMETKIMFTIDFQLGRPLPLHFLRRNSKAGFVNAKIHALAKFIMELSLVDYKLAHIYPSLLAAAALAYAMRVFDQNSNTSLTEMWTPTLVYYSSYTIQSIMPLLKELARLVQKTVNAPEDTKLMQVRKKYSNKKFLCIAKVPQLKSTIALSLAEED